MNGNTRLYLLALITALLLAAGCLSSQPATDSMTPPGMPVVTGTGGPLVSGDMIPYDFGNPKKSAHYVSNTPAHGARLGELPGEVALDFNFVLGSGSAISISSGGRDYATGSTSIDLDRLTMRRPIDPAAPDGLYQVTYNACWPDGSCHDGNFRFAVNRAETARPQPAASPVGAPAGGSVMTTARTTAPQVPPVTVATPDYGIPKKSPHFETSTPAHGSVLAGVPVNAVIDFNFDLGPGSGISVMSGGREYGTGVTVIDPNRLAMRRPIDPAAPDGLYEANYHACWPDGSCHDGIFRFAIDRALARQFTDLTGQPQVTIRMKDIAFEPALARVTRGTTVTWVNDEAVEHFVNTESHPAHTYYLPQNSRGLLENDTFPLVFDSPGIYPYHCSAHAAVMTGAILVE